VHRPLRASYHLDEILSVRFERTIANDYTVRLNNRFFQIFSGQGVRPRQALEVEIRLDGSTHLRWKDRYLRYQAIAKKPVRPQVLPREIRELLANPRPRAGLGSPIRGASTLAGETKRFSRPLPMRKPISWTDVLGYDPPTIASGIESACVWAMRFIEDRQKTQNKEESGSWHV